MGVFLGLCVDRSADIAGRSRLAGDEAIKNGVALAVAIASKPAPTVESREPVSSLRTRSL
jgi:hypothetical protein